MKLTSLILASAFALTGAAFTAGCDETVEKKETVIKRDGETVSRDKVEVKREADGDLKEEEVHEKNP